MVKIKRKEIAKFLGMSPGNVSRMMRDRGVYLKQKHVYMVLDFIVEQRMRIIFKEIFGERWKEE
jgi:DNA-binding transcriptional regulator GbsR (MarR family)